MILVKLSFKERMVISKVAKLFCDLAIHGEGYDDRIRQFWRISMYVKAGFLYRKDLETICTAMESFNEEYKKRPGYMDPDGEFKNMDVIISKMKALLGEKQTVQAS